MEQRLNTVHVEARGQGGEVTVTELKEGAAWKTGGKPKGYSILKAK